MARNLAIVGGGLIGTSIALAARDAAAASHVSIFERDEQARSRLGEKGAADVISDDLRLAVAGADLVVLATPVSSFAQIVDVLAECLPKGALVTDVASVKASVLPFCARLAERGVEFVPAHPLAGGHGSGPDHADPRLFAGKTCIVTPTDENAPAALAAIEAFWCDLGMQIERMPAELHDRVVAMTSHLPHLVASAIVFSAGAAEKSLGQSLARYVASGFRDTTRIAAASPKLWNEIYFENRAAVLDMAELLETTLGAMKLALKNDDRLELFGMLRAAQEQRIGINNTKIPYGKLRGRGDNTCP